MTQIRTFLSWKHKINGNPIILGQHDPYSNCQQQPSGKHLIRESKQETHLLLPIYPRVCQKHQRTIIKLKWNPVNNNKMAKLMRKITKSRHAEAINPAQTVNSIVYGDENSFKLKRKKYKPIM